VAKVITATITQRTTSSIQNRIPSIKYPTTICQTNGGQVLHSQFSIFNCAFWTSFTPTSLSML